MCNHTEKNQMVLSMAVDMIERGAGVRPDVLPPLSEDGDVEAVPYESWPKMNGLVAVNTPAGLALTVQRWGVIGMHDGKPVTVTNARNDTMLKPRNMWEESLAGRRCLVPVSAYFEPGIGPPGARGELRFTVRDRPTFFLAGLWQRAPDGVACYAICTTEPNDYARPFHDRMPVVLSDADAFRWWGHQELSRDEIVALTRPCPSDLMQHTVIPARPKAEKPAKPAKITKADLSSGQGELLF